MLEMSRSLDLILKCRSFAIIGQIAAILVAHYRLELPLNIVVLSIIIGISSLLTLISFSLNKKTTASNLHILSQLSYDIVSFTILLFFTGGIQNPFTGLYLIQVIIAAILLPARYSWSIVLISGFSYFSLTLMPSQDHHHHVHMGLLNLHMEGMIISYIVSALLVAIFIGKIAENHREQTNKLIQMESQIKQDTIIGNIGLLASNAAHELSTPLSTIGLITEELDESSPDKTLTLTLKNQVDRCKQLLQEMLLSFGTVRAEKINFDTITNYMEKLKELTRTLYPDTTIHFQQTRNEHIEYFIPSILDRAILNIIDNARNTTATTINCSLLVEDTTLSITVKDNGPGIQSAIIERIEEFGKTLKLQKRGLGLYLSKTIIEKLGGTISFTVNNGTIVTITVPLERKK